MASIYHSFGSIMRDYSIKFVAVSVGAYLIAPALLAILVGGLVHAIARRGILSSEAASWVQAIGVTAGIGIAIYVPWRQRNDAVATAEQQRVDNALRVSLAFRDELTLAAGHFNGANVIEVLREAPTELFGGTIPISEDRFPIYQAMANRLVEIDDEETRRSIINAYAALSSVIAMVVLNNRLIEEYGILLRRRYVDNVEALDPELAERKKVLISFRRQMRGIVVTSIKDVHAAVLLLDRAIRGTHDDYSPQNKVLA